MYGLTTTHLDSLAPSIEDSGTNPAAFFCFALICDDLFRPIPTSGIVAIGTAVANNSQCAAPKRCPRPAVFFCVTVCFGTRGDKDLHRWAHRWTQQPLETVLRTNRVDLGSFSSRCCAFRRTHTCTDPIWLLYIRLALALTLPLPSGFVPSARLLVCVSPRALRPVCYFLCVCMFWDERG